jgi:hypothetical protein
MASRNPSSGNDSSQPATSPQLAAWLLRCGLQTQLSFLFLSFSLSFLSFFQLSAPPDRLPPITGGLEARARGGRRRRSRGIGTGVSARGRGACGAFRRTKAGPALRMSRWAGVL